VSHAEILISYYIRLKRVKVNFKYLFLPGQLFSLI